VLLAVLAPGAAAGEHMMELEFLDQGVEAFAFTFG
jgi:hypothetical protein